MQQRQRALRLRGMTRGLRGTGFTLKYLASAGASTNSVRVRVRGVWWAEGQRGDGLAMAGGSIPLGHPVQ